MIAKGAQVEIGIWQVPMPPISVGVVNEAEAPGLEEEGVPLEPDYRCDRCSALYVAKRAVDELGLKCGRSWCGGELRLPGAGDGDVAERPPGPPEPARPPDHRPVA